MPSSRKAWTGGLLALDLERPGSGSSRAEPWRSRLVSSLTRIVPGSASCCRRAARFVVSPDRRVVRAELVADPADHHPAGIDPHPDLELHALLARRARRDARARSFWSPRAARAARRAWSSWAIGRPEQGHEAVAQELVDRPLVAVDLGEGQLEEPVEQQVHGLGPQPLGQRRRAHEVAEEDGDLLALALRGRDLDWRTWAARCGGV